jgi:hypothetical protein
VSFFLDIGIYLPDKRSGCEEKELSHAEIAEGAERGRSTLCEKNNMSKPFKNLIEKMPAERRQRIKQKAKNLKTQMAIGELRRALELTQEQVSPKG